MNKLRKICWQMLVFIGPGLFAISCAESAKDAYKRTDNGIIVFPEQAKTGDARAVKLQVVTDDIIRVAATPENRFPERESLIIIPQKQNNVHFELVEKNDILELTTAKIKAKIALSTGEVGFYTLNDKPLLEEEKGNSKTFEPISADGFDGYSFRQVFNSPDDEAFYGLGQHQSDEWNYKGKNEELYQYNTKVSVPFVLSNKNYGILWDNYSLTRFGNPKDYSPMNKNFKLYEEDGKAGGLTATYTTAQGTVFAERKEAEIVYESLSDLGKFPAGFPFYNSKIEWKGQIEAKESGTYYFRLYYAGYTKVYVGGEEVVPERWRTAWNPNVYKFKVDLKKGEKVPFRIDWKPDGGESYLGLRAMAPRPEAEQKKLSLWSEMGQEMDYYFIHGENMDEIISGYRQLTGKATILPHWAYGFWQSRERYKTQEEIVNTLKEFRQRRIPIDNIVQDWSYWKEDDWGSHEFDPARFPDPQKMIDDIHAMNARIMISVWPKFYASTKNFKELDAKGYIYQQAIEDSIRDWISSGYLGSFYDPYSREARDIFWRQMKDNLYQYGIDAWWMDASEPDIQSNASLEYRKKLSTPTAIGSSTEYFNTYSLLNADAIYNGQRAAAPDKRVFLLTRSGFAGLQRYATATWSGDIGTRWEDMKAQITAGMNFALSGIPYWTMDIGGFCVEKRYETAKEGSPDMEEWRELNTRWYQFGAFVPLFRSHGQYPYREAFHIAPESHKAYQSIVHYTRLRYRLMPYIYSLAGHIYFDDYTMMRALVMDFAADKKVENIDDQYLFGPSLMVCPVVEYKAREREVYLPAGASWYNANTGDFFEGGQSITAAAPYETMPLFIKAGSILPIGPEIEYTGQKPDAPLKIIVYKGAEGSFKLYEDEGINYNYEQDKYSFIPFHWDDKAEMLTIGEREGDFEGMLQSRTFEIVFADNSGNATFDFDKLKGKTVEYSGRKIEITKH